MNARYRWLAILILCTVICLPGAAAPAEKAGLPVLVTSCGQSPGPMKVQVFLKKLQLDHVYNLQASAKDLVAGKSAGTPFKSLIIVSGASLKGMGAAGVSINDEIARIKALIEEARKQGIKVIGAHVEGMARRAQGAAPGDNSDEMSIDAVCPFSSLLIVRKDGNEDGRFTTISQAGKIPLFEFEKNLDLEQLLAGLFRQDPAP
ncbi:MAG: hypothetical protein FJW35_16330 [Acidobacteria bacterium]|nr:hypothetical protein [Acidobacteriota bacterium]